MKSSKLCCVKFCRNRRKPQRTMCYKHLARRYKSRHLIKYRYNIAKQSAKSRGIEWSLTYEEFAQFCEDTGYLKGSGKSRENLTMDRIDPSKGYSVRNLRVLPHYLNSKLGAIYGAYLGLIERRRCSS